VAVWYMGVARDTCSFDTKLEVGTVLLGDSCFPRSPVEAYVQSLFPLSLLSAFPHLPPPFGGK
jgi:hypothetical protein